jgi:hypothetical protein
MHVPARGSSLFQVGLVIKWAVSRGERDTGLTWDPREGSHRANGGQARGCPMRGPAYEPSPQVKPVSRSPFELKPAPCDTLVTLDPQQLDAMTAP